MYQNEITHIIPVLEKSGLILYPTDTVWGIGCNAFDENAVKKVFDLKQRPKEKNMILLLSGIEMLENYVERIHPKIYSLHDYYERPVTVVYESPKNLPKFLLAQDGSVAMRIAKDVFCKELINTLGNPIISTSANISGEPSASVFDEVSEEVKKGMDYIVKHRRSDISKTLPSVIVKLSSKYEFEVLRD